MSQETTGFSIDDIVVDPATLQLSRGGRTITVQPKVMDLFVALAARRGTVMSHDALQRQVWPGVVVGYHAVTRAVSQLRKALSDLAPGRILLETIPRRGYRLATAAPEAIDQAPAVRLGRGTAAPAAASAAAVGAFGLVMHAAGLHGQPAHLVAIPGVAAAVFWLTARRAEL